MADRLPDEIWIKIFGYTTMEDRIRNIQFSCKRFYGLCADYTLTHDLDFSKAIFLPEGMCLNVVNRAKEYVSRLSFKGCHWLNSSLFMDLPHLPALETLNIVCCLLDVDQILSLLQKMPKLKNLALTLSFEQVQYIYENSTQVRPKIQLRRLHLHVYKEMTDIWDEGERNEWPNYFEYMLNMFFPDPLPEFISVAMHDGITRYMFGKISRTFADLGEDMKDFVFKNEVFCCFPRKLGMHKPLITERNISPVLDFSQLKYLRIPEACFCATDLECTGVLPPHSLPNLEYLLCSWDDEKCDYECYHKLTQGIVFDCQLPRLKYLHFTASGILPVEFYTNVAKMKNLREFHLLASYDTDLLLHTIKNLPLLESLRIPLPYTDGQLYLEDIVSAVPKLKKLYVGVIQFRDSILHFLEPISKLFFLENLDINISLYLDLSDYVDVLCTVLRNLHQLTTFELCYVRKQTHVFAEVIHKALKFLPNLVHLILKTGGEPTQNLLEAVKECKKLEKLWIDEFPMKNPIESSTLIPLLDEVITSLPRLHLIVICGHGYSESVTESVKEFNKKLQIEGRKVSVYYGNICMIPAVFGPIHPIADPWSTLPVDLFELETRIIDVQ